MLPGIGGLEYIFIAILLIIFVGPKDLPFLIRSLSRTFGKIKNLAKEFKLMIKKRFIRNKCLILLNLE